jgi:ubiquinone/menaquinone biosynthesis C-methylase UbiE
MKNLSSIKSLIYQKIPKSILLPTLSAYGQFKTRKVRQVFENADPYPASLDLQTLETLQNLYSYKIATQYDTQSVTKRGQEKAERILQLIGKPSKNLLHCLELGAGRGEVSEYLQQKGRQVTAIDIDLSNKLDKLGNNNINYYEMNATQLTFPQESFDLIFSFNAFEHFLHPDLVLKEAIRVLKKGGYLYLSFDPLYYSPWGLHVYHIITFPYSQCLFSEKILNDFIRSKGLCQLDDQLNRWSIEKYRGLWKQFNSILQPCFYYEKINPFYINLIEEYPTCFKSKNQSFENFIVSGIEVLFKKVDEL